MKTINEPDLFTHDYFYDTYAGNLCHSKTNIRGFVPAVPIKYVYEMLCTGITMPATKGFISYLKNPSLKNMSYSKVLQSPSEMQIYKYLLNKGESSKKELLANLKIPKATLTRSLLSMIRKGAIVKLKHGRYFLPDFSDIDMIINKYTSEAMEIIKKDPDTKHVRMEDIIDRI